MNRVFCSVELHSKQLARLILNGLLLAFWRPCFDSLTINFVFSIMFGAII